MNQERIVKKCIGSPKCGVDGYCVRRGDGENVDECVRDEDAIQKTYLSVYMRTVAILQDQVLKLSHELKMTKEAKDALLQSVNGMLESLDLCLDEANIPNENVRGMISGFFTGERMRAIEAVNKASILEDKPDH